MSLSFVVRLARAIVSHPPQAVRDPGMPGLDIQRALK